MKIHVISLVAATFLLLTGCDTVKNFVFRPVVTTETVVLADGTTAERVSTNGWEVAPSVGGAIRLVGDVAPIPWAAPVTSALLGILGVVGALLGKRYKKATVVGIQTLDNYRKGTMKLTGGKVFDDEEIKEVIKAQKAGGVHGLFSKLVDVFTGRTK